jgi:uncharacterized protein (UPF0261 family)
VGGVLTAGPHRLEAAGRKGLPQLVCPGAIDMVNFGPAEPVPARFQSRNFYLHNPSITLMRTTPDECAELVGITADKLNRARGPVTVLIPLQVSPPSTKPGRLAIHRRNQCLPPCTKSRAQPCHPAGRA